MRSLVTALIFMFFIAQAPSSWACEKSFDPRNIFYKPGTKIEVSFAMDMQPSYSAIYKHGDQPEYLVHFHRINGEEMPFHWPEGTEFAEGASSWDTDFFTRLEFTIFEPQMRWTFFPENQDNSQWHRVLDRLDAVIDLELQKGAIDQKLADFAKTYHHSVMKRHVSHIFLRPPSDQTLGAEAWETLSIIHGGTGGGLFPGPFLEPATRYAETPSLLQIEESFPDLVLPERAKYGQRAELYEFVRLASVGDTSLSALDQLAPVVARHLAQKNGQIVVLSEEAGIYFLVPTKAHERHYVKFFQARNIPMQKIADVGPGFMVYRIPMIDFVRHYLNVRFLPLK